MVDQQLQSRTLFSLKSPFVEKDYAKSLGAKWDLEKKVWYIPDGAESCIFEEWAEWRCISSRKGVIVSASYHYVFHVPRTSGRSDEVLHFYF
ncbi:DUF5710 domain-containing protein [Brevibacillus porteri]|uniref:DUF5710 domain-containing protein n=1 Tax=Brevibacillus porteri TaxID=2126350 RepID=UPI003D1FB782